MMYTTIRGGPAGARVDAIVLLIPRLKRVSRDDRPTDRYFAAAFDAARGRPELADRPGSFVDFLHEGRRVLAVAIGEMHDRAAENLRVAAAKLTRPLHERRVASMQLVVSPALAEQIEAEALGRLFSEGLGLGSFRYERFKASQSPHPRALTLRSSDAAVRRGITDGLALADAANYTRQLQATPPNIASPDYIAREARSLASRQGSRLKCRVFRGDALKKHRFVGLMNVGRGSAHKPCMIQLEYPSRRRGAPTVVLIGKTLTFDSGGLSLKINNGMRYMKYDKSGGMAVLGAMRAIADRDLRCNVVALLPAAENAISHEAYRVDDILEYPNGVSVEVTNTDAEGRLVLADALAYACRTWKPAAVIDLATLTGGIVSALGEHMAGLFSANDPLRQRIEEAAERAGEPVWRMPLTQEHRDALQSHHADLVNSTLSPAGSPCVAAAFLERFVDPPDAWAHLDIAGPAMTEKARSIYPPGPTGFGTRLLIHLLRRW